MGIKSLKQYLTKHCPNSIHEIPLKLFSGHCIAIDIDVYEYKYMAVSMQRVLMKTDLVKSDPDKDEILNIWFGCFIDLIVTLFNNGITPVFVKGGSSPPDKLLTIQKRREEVKKRDDKIFELMTKIRMADILMVSRNDVEILRGLMKQCSKVTKEDSNNLRLFLLSLGIPYIVATGEGERLCASLCIENKVSAVMSTDSDLLCMGAKFILTDFAPAQMTENGLITKINLLSLDGTLGDLGMNLETFREVCIMAGCDFNKNIPKIGIDRSYKMIQKYGSIEEFGLKEKKDITILNHLRCRELFKYVESSKIVDEKVSSPVSSRFYLDDTFDRIRPLLESSGLSDHINKLLDAFLKYRSLQPKLELIITPV